MLSKHDGHPLHAGAGPGRAGLHAGGVHHRPPGRGLDHYDVRYHGGIFRAVCGADHRGQVPVAAGGSGVQAAEIFSGEHRKAAKVIHEEFTQKATSPVT